MNFCPAGIRVSHRLGQQNSAQGQDKRPFVAKTCRRDLGREFLFNERKQKTDGFFVSERFTAAKRKIFNTLRSISKAHP